MQVPLSTLIPLEFLPEPLRSIAQRTETQDYRITSIIGGAELSFHVLPSTAPLTIPIGDDNGLTLVIDKLATIAVRFADELRFSAGFDQLTIQLPEFLRPASLQNGRWTKDET